MEHLTGKRKEKQKVRQGKEIVRELDLVEMGGVWKLDSGSCFVIWLR